LLCWPRLVESYKAAVRCLPVRFVSHLFNVNAVHIGHILSDPPGGSRWHYHSMSLHLSEEWGPILLQLQPFYGPLSRTTQVSRY